MQGISRFVGGSMAVVLAAIAAACGSSGGELDYKRSCPAGDGSEQCAVFDLVNQERASAGLVPYEWNAELAAAAQAHCEDMLANDYFDHTGLDGSTFVTRSEAAGYTGMPTGENIAMNPFGAQGVMDSWMNSDGHRANILSDTSTEIGVGYCGGELWVQVFGRA